jgi:hypothetical protein
MCRIACSTPHVMMYSFWVGHVQRTAYTLHLAASGTSVIYYVLMRLSSKEMRLSGILHPAQLC